MRPAQAEDVLVAVADSVWKGKRTDTLESRAAEMIAQQTEREGWDVFCLLDTICEGVAAGGERRLAWQRRPPKPELLPPSSPLHAVTLW